MPPVVDDEQIVVHHHQVAVDDEQEEEEEECTWTGWIKSLQEKSKSGKLKQEQEYNLLKRERRKNRKYIESQWLLNGN